jgi:DNA-directed RNA polymerase subunit RPC12/RpoP
MHGNTVEHKGFLETGAVPIIVSRVVPSWQLRYKKDATVRKCGYCGGSRLKRVHRTFIERFSYLAIYECQDCEHEEFVPRHYTYHLGDEARCPNCGTYRLSKLRGIDKIDKMATGPFNRIEKLLGGTLYHCVFCRLQFYDRRKAAPRTVLEPISPHVEVEAVPVPEGRAPSPGGMGRSLIVPAPEPEVKPRPPRELDITPIITPPPESAPPHTT